MPTFGGGLSRGAQAGHRLPQQPDNRALCRGVIAWATPTSARPTTWRVTSSPASWGCRSCTAMSCSARTSHAAKEGLENFAHADGHRLRDRVLPELDYHALNAKLNLRRERQVICPMPTTRRPGSTSSSTSTRTRSSSTTWRRSSSTWSRRATTRATSWTSTPRSSSSPPSCRLRTQVPLETFLGAFKYYIAYTLKT